jgi:galactokinase
MVLQSLLREAVWVAVQPRRDNVIRLLNPGATHFGWQPSLEVEVADLSDIASLRLLCNSSQGTHWASYVLGALHFLKSHKGWSKTGGADLFIASDLPPNRGVSSSAALEVATLKAASTARGISLDGIALATAAQWVENVVVESACGIMDQAAIVLGEANRLLPILCQPCQPSPPIPLPPGLRIWGIDSMASRSTTGIPYETARAAAFIGYKLICQHDGIPTTPETISGIPRWTDPRLHGYLSNLTPSEFRSKYERRLPESISGRDFLAQASEHLDPFTTIHPHRQYPVRAAVRYATEENLRVQTVHALLQSSPAEVSDRCLQLIGEILHQSHLAYADCGLGSEACDDLVSRALQAGLPGAKMTGGGAGGVVAILGRPNDRHIIDRIAQQYAAERGAMPHIFAGSSNGVDASGTLTLHLPALQETQ